MEFSRFWDRLREEAHGRDRQARRGSQSWRPREDDHRRVESRTLQGLDMALIWKLRVGATWFFFCFSIYTPQQLPNTRARRG